MARSGNANHLLRNVEGEATAGAYQNPTNTDLPTDVGNVSPALSKNRFSPGNPYNAGAYKAKSEDKTSIGSQRFKGKQVANSLGKYDTDFEGLAMTELTQIAEQLLMRAVGDNTGKNPGDKGASTFDLGGDGKLPGAQIRGRSPKFNADTDFRAATTVKAIKSNDLSSREDIVGAMATYSDPLATSTNRKSFGVLNNHLEQFGAALPTSMIVLAAVAAVTILVVSLVLAAILDILGVFASLGRGEGFGGGLNPKASWQIYGPNKDVTTLPLGQAYGKDDFSDTGFFSVLYKYMGIPPLDAEYPPGIPFLTATLFGTLEFFIGNSLNGGSFVPQITTNAAGYYTVVVRNAMRDMEQISKAADEMGGGGLVGGIEGFFSLIDAFRSSATFRFAMVMVTIGDRVRCGPGLMGNRDNGGQWWQQIMTENDTASQVTVSQLHTVVRIASKKPRLSYSFSALPQLFLRPGEAQTRTTSLGFIVPLTPTTTPGAPYNRTDGPPDVSMVSGIKDLPSTDIVTGQSMYVKGDGGEGNFVNRLTYFEGGRINTDTREAIETELNTYYMPFYFHDLRTNEILPLPCFVSDISDSFSPKWSEVSGFGRADPVQIYGGTTRKIGFSFYMVATNTEDYSALWYGINKLVSLVYPQWGGARSITNSKNETFDVPYSSIPTASPLIRLRLGELFASNRAPETVRRLFGANKAGFQVDDGAGAGTPVGQPADGMTDDEWLKKEGEMRKVKRRGPHALATPDTITLIEATQIFNQGAAASIANFAGCDYNSSGGAQGLHGDSILLPAGMTIRVKSSAGKLQFASWKGLSYATPFWNKLKLPKEGTSSFKIVNYYIDSNKLATVESGGEYCKGTIYYVCEPVAESPLQVAYDAKKKKVEDGVGGSVKGVLVPLKEVGFLEWPSSAPNPLPIPPFPPSEAADEPITDKKFFDNNLIVGAMKESGGQGLAGAITQLDFNWNEAPWETSADLGRAPQYVKVTLSFSPIHDEPLGLNSDGSLRAAAYPVGKTIESVMGPRFKYPHYYEGAGIAALTAAIEEAKAAAAGESDPSSPKLPG